MRSLLLILFLPAVSWAGCFLPKTSPWYWNRDQLIARSRVILLVKEIEARKTGAKNSSPQPWTYRFEVLETLKGEPQEELILTDMRSPYSGSGIQTGPRARHDDQCKIDVGFEDGKTYLIFKGLHKGIFNPRAYQEVTGADDPWVVQARSKIKK